MFISWDKDLIFSHVRVLQKHRHDGVKECLNISSPTCHLKQDYHQHQTGWASLRNLQGQRSHSLSGDLGQAARPSWWGRRSKPSKPNHLRPLPFGVSSDSSERSAPPRPSSGRPLRAAAASPAGGPAAANARLQRPSPCRRRRRLAAAMAGGSSARRLWQLCNLLMAAFFGLAAAVQVRAAAEGLGLP